MSPGRGITPLRSKPRDGVDEPCSPTPPTGHQHQSGHVMCYEGQTSSRAIDSADFEGQIGKFIDNSRPPQDFEAERRTRVFLAPERWRIGATALPGSDPD